MSRRGPAWMRGPLALPALLVLLAALPPRGSCDADAELLAWAAEADGYESLLAISHDLPQGRGLVVTRDVPADTLLLFVPKDKALSLASCDMDGAQQAFVQKEAPNQYVAMALALVFERSRGAESRFAPYIAALPAVEGPPRNLFYWTEQQLALAFGVVDTDDGAFEATFRCPADAKAVLERLVAQGVGRGWGDWLSSAEPGGWAAEQGEDVLRWACSMAFSRNFDSVFYPVADMANHAFKADQQENSLAMTYDKSCMKLLRQPKKMQPCASATIGAGRGFFTTRPWAKGEQLFDFYGWYGNVYLLLAYGFADPDGNGGTCSKLLMPLTKAQGTSLERTFGSMRHECGGHRTAACGIAGACQGSLSPLRWPLSLNKVHSVQRLSSASESGVVETMSDCLRIGSYFSSAAQLNAGLGEGFQLFSPELLPALALPVGADGGPQEDGHRWSVAKDEDHFLAIRERCAAVDADESELADLGEQGEAGDVRCLPLLLCRRAFWRQLVVTCCRCAGAVCRRARGGQH